MVHPTPLGHPTRARGGAKAKPLPIVDCEAFIDKHYPAHTGRRHEVRCYCK